MNLRKISASLIVTVIITVIVTAGVMVSGALAQTGGLTGTQWRLSAFGGASGETPVIAGSAASLAFETADQAGGNGGCNSFGGQYAVEGDTLRLSGIVSTLMACADSAVMTQEAAYLGALQAAERYELAGDRLLIHYGSGQWLAFERAGQPAPPVQPAPPAEPFEDLDSPVGLLASYYNAIGLQDYARAYGYWETPPDPFDAFASGFADTASVQVIVQPPMRYSGAAGSLYVEIPTVLLAQHFDGAQLMYAGCFVARTSNLQPPDIPQPDVWHLYSADIVEVAHDPATIPALLAGACPGASSSG